ncbi:hypothetical protein [Phyllobacterium phragmitis]|nr:hypothetical protein [Phyllobacterium phragmitis]
MNAEDFTYENFGGELSLPPEPECLPCDEYKYVVPVVTEHEGERLTGRLAVTRDPSGWEGALFFRHHLRMDMDQVSTPHNGGFWHMPHERFLRHVQLVFSFSGGADFEFATDDFEPFFADEEDGPLWVKHAGAEARH